MTAETVRHTVDQRVAASMKGFGVLGSISFVLIAAAALLGPAIAAVFILVWAWLSYTPVSEIGLKKPKSWVSAIVIGVIFGVALKLLLKSVVLPYFGAPETNAAFQGLRGDTKAFLIWIVQVFVLVGFAEELLFRGYLINRLLLIFGQNAGAKTLTVLISAFIFGIAHWSGQQFWGSLQGGIVGLVFASAYMLNGERLVSLIVAHTAFDVFALWIIYAGQEERFAHLVFP
jgi:membrane protease YdiL (CAAX protease family)